MTGLQLDEQIARIALNQGATPQLKTMLTDALGSVIAIAKADQSLEVGYAYSAYGQTQKVGVENQQTGSENNSQYTGRENDQNGLYYYRARYYDPLLTRFISEDPIGLAGGINSYAYVEGDPVSNTDPEGLRNLRLQNPIQQPLPFMPTPRPGPQPIPQPLQPRPSSGNGNAQTNFQLIADSFGNLDKNTPSNTNWGGDLPSPLPYYGSQCVYVCAPEAPGACGVNSGCRVVCGPTFDQRK